MHCKRKIMINQLQLFIDLPIHKCQQQNNNNNNNNSRSNNNNKVEVELLYFNIKFITEADTKYIRKEGIEE